MKTCTNEKIDGGGVSTGPVGEKTSRSAPEASEIHHTWSVFSWVTSPVFGVGSTP